MTVNEAAEKLSLTWLNAADPERAVDGAYTGDLLSWVMGNACAGNAWATIMTNQNILAVATLIELSCVIICEDSEIDPSLIALAKEKGVNLLRSPQTAYGVCKALALLGV